MNLHLSIWLSISLKKKMIILCRFTKGGDHSDNFYQKSKLLIVKEFRPLKKFKKSIFYSIPDTHPLSLTTWSRSIYEPRVRQIISLE